MRLKKGRCLAAVTLCFLVFTAVCVFAAADRIVFTDSFRTDKVDIRLQELYVNTADMLLANKKLEYTPRIVNKGTECYIRAKVDIHNGGDSPQPLGIHNIYGQSGGWIRQGEYYYWTSPVKNGQHIDLFRGLHIPEDWDPGTVSDLTVSVKAEAVQSRNFVPDFKESLPWGAVMLQDIGKGTGTAETVAEKKISDITFSKAGTFEFGTSDLFDEYRDVLPGDRYRKTFRVYNSSKYDLGLDLKIYALDTDLTEKLLLDISCEGQTLFSGTVSGAGTGEALQLCEIPEGAGKTLLMEMTLPADADNSYSELMDDVIWQLEARTAGDRYVRTGDDTDMRPFAAAVLLAGGLMLTVTVRKKGSKWTK